MILYILFLFFVLLLLFEKKLKVLSFSFKVVNFISLLNKEVKFNEFVLFVELKSLVLLSLLLLLFIPFFISKLGNIEEADFFMGLL